MPRKDTTPKFVGGATVSQIEKSPSPFWIVIVLIVALAYGCGFLWLPLREGVLGDDGETISRARYIFTSIFYPEMRFSTWIDGGRLPIGFSDRIPIVVGTCVWLGLSAWIGLPLVNPIYTKGGTWSSRIEQCAFAILVGLGLLSSLVLLVGLLGGLQSRLGLCAAIAMLLFAVHCITRYTSVFEVSLVHSVLNTKPVTTMPESLAAIESKRSVMGQVLFGAVVGLTCIASVILMLGAWLPPSEFDVLEYHLQAPKEFFQAGAIRFVPHNIYANMPLGTEMHSLAMMTLLGDADAWWGGLIGKSITCSISIVGAALLGAFVSRKLGAMFGWSAAGLWLTSPGIAQVAMFGLIDGALAAYVLASAIATFYAIEAMRNCEDSNATNPTDYQSSGYVF